MARLATPLKFDAQSINGSIDKNGITSEARFYALKELVRRAGVSAQDFDEWTVEIESDQTIVYPQPRTTKAIRFKHAHPDFWEKLNSDGLSSLNTGRFSWMLDPPPRLRQALPNFIVPYCSIDDLEESRPLFLPVSPDIIECETDLLLTVLLVLSRAEELEPSVRDQYDRFTAASSLAFRDGFLERPMIDEYGLAFEQALSCLLPGWHGDERILRVKLSHDIDSIGIPFALRPAIGHTFLRHRPHATAWDLVAAVAGLRPTYLSLVPKIVQMSRQHGLCSAVYWKAGSPSPNDSGYDPRDPRIYEVISWLEEQGVENGVHPGYTTYLSAQRLRQEVEILQETLGTHELGGRQHYLRWSPQTWQDWENCALAYDSSVGYADLVGFRAGTCFPYRPWLLWQNREANLIEIPLIVMDCVPIVRMGLNPEQGLELITQYIEKCRLVGGVFTLLWHNTTLIEPAYGNLYEKVLQKLSGLKTFDWREADVRPFPSRAWNTPEIAVFENPPMRAKINAL